MLRPFRRGDVEALAVVFGQREAWWDVLSIPDMPDDPHDVAAHRIADSMSGWRAHGAGFWALTILSAELGPVGRLVGYCGFVSPAKSEASQGSDSLEVGWGIDPAYQRRGLAAEAMVPVLDYAFEIRGCSRLGAITHPENHASRALMERLGFRFERDLNAYGEPQVRYVLEPADHVTRA